VIIDDLQIIDWSIVLKHVAKITLLGVQTETEHAQTAALPRVLLHIKDNHQSYHRPASPLNVLK